MGDREPRQWQQGPTRGAMNGLIGGLWGWEEEEDREPRRQWARASEDPEREELRARVQARVMEVSTGSDEDGLYGEGHAGKVFSWRCMHMHMQRYHRGGLCILDI